MVSGFGIGIAIALTRHGRPFIVAVWVLAMWAILPTLFRLWLRLKLRHIRRERSSIG